MTIIFLLHPICNIIKCQFAHAHANMSINRCVYSQFYHPPSACVQHLQSAPRHHFPILLFFLHLDRMTAYIEKQNATSCQAENKTKQPICFGFIQEKKAQLRQQFGHIKNDIAHILVTWRRESDKTVNSIICCKVRSFNHFTVFIPDGKDTVNSADTTWSLKEIQSWFCRKH